MSEQEYISGQAYAHQKLVVLDAIRQDRVEQKMIELFGDPVLLFNFIQENIDAFNDIMIDIISEDLDSKEN